MSGAGPSPPNTIWISSTAVTTGKSLDEVKVTCRVRVRVRNRERSSVPVRVRVRVRVGVKVRVRVREGYGGAQAGYRKGKVGLQKRYSGATEEV